MKLSHTFRTGVFPTLVLLWSLLAVDGASGQQVPPRSLFADHKAHAVGDLITILLVENANASQEVSSERRTDNSLASSGKASGNLLSFLPLFGVSSQIKTDSDGRARTQQRDRLSARLSAVIEEIDDAGLFKVRGTRLININGERNLLTVRGLVRPRDIRHDNTVFSYHVAQARIYYSKPGVAGHLVKRWTVPRFLTVALGLGLVGLGVLGGLQAVGL